MSLTREHGRQKNGCPSRGLGIAAVAIGAGVGAALYYFFNKRAEHPNGEGSSSDWNEEREQPLHQSDDSYTTISEHDTTDTSIHQSPDSMTQYHDYHLNDNDWLNDSEVLVVSGFDSDSEMDDDSEMDERLSSSINASDSEDIDFDVTTSSLGVPYDDDRSRSPLAALSNSLSSFWEASVSPWLRTHLTEEEQMAMIREEQFRDRPWTEENCSICFDKMHRHQDLTQLPCSHNFHTECIVPWLQEKQTCPYCRKNV